MPTEIPVGELADTLARPGITADGSVKLAIDLASELVPGRREARARVIAAELSDSDIDRLIKEAQKEVGPLIKQRICW